MKRAEQGELFEHGYEYDAFVKKFEPKKTTDDCYTPHKVYEAVAEWVAREYKKDRAAFVRPFYPGGNYEEYAYKESDIVVDNPPFSILSKIVRFYNEHGILFFLFAPHLTLFTNVDDQTTGIITDNNITYENGANVHTAFLTNMDRSMIRTASDLYKEIKKSERRRNERTS